MKTKEIVLDKYSYGILSMLKENFEKQSPTKEFQIKGTGKNISARQFYLESLNDNFIEPMSARVKGQFEKGSGNELKDKMKALRSSSAMAYNLFRNDDAIFLDEHSFGAGRYTVEFEKQFRTLKRGTPAHLDAFLYCEESKEAIACEMKMCEWIFHGPSKLKNKYLLTENYKYPKSAKVFIEIAKNLIVSASEDELTEIEEHDCIMKQYDAFQMFKHTLACYNLCEKQEISIKKLTLVNCVWELPFSENLSQTAQNRYKKQLKLEHDKFDKFDKIMQPSRELFGDIGVDFKIRYYSFSEFMKIMELDSKTRDYLKRYT